MSTFQENAKTPVSPPPTAGKLTNSSVTTRVGGLTDTVAGTTPTVGRINPYLPTTSDRFRPAALAV